MTRLLAGTGWAAAHALESLSRLTAGMAAWPFVARVLAETDQPLVRSAALKAAASVGGPEALEACLAELRSPRSNYSQVQAIVSLLMMEAPADVRVPALVALARSSRLDVATQAILGLVGGDDRRAGLSIRDWLLEGSDEARVQAAYCLGYHQGRSAVRVLENLVLKDPCPAVRQQALRALAYYDRTPDVNGVLLRFLRLPDERLAIDAVRILSSSDNSGDSEIAGALASVVSSAQPGPLRLAACRALGRFSDAGSRALLQQLLGETAGSPALLRAAIDAVGVSVGGAPELGPLRTLLGHAQPEVRAGAALVLFRWGELDGLPVLAEMAAGTDVELREALAALEEIAFIVDHLALEPGFKALAARLRENLDSLEFENFSGRALGSAIVPIVSRGWVDPHAAVLGRVAFIEEPLGGGEPNQVVAAVETARSKVRAAPVPRLQPLAQVPELPSVAGLEVVPGARRGRLPAIAALVAILVVALAGGAVLATRESALEADPEMVPTADRPVPAAGSSAPAAGLEPRAMAVLEVSGTVLLAGGPGAPATPAVVGRPVTAGQRVETGKGASVRLGLGASSNAVLLKGEGALEIEAIEADPGDPTVQRLKLGGFAGRLVFNFKWGRPRVDATAGGLSFHGLRGLYGIESRPGGGILRVASGRIEVKGPGNQVMLVSGGQKFVYTVAAGRGEIEPYDEKDEPLE
jgi:HEAT repeat protein